MKITQYGETYEVTLTKTTYANNGNLAIALTCDTGEPYGVLTVNLGEKLPADMAYVDTNNMPSAEKFIRENNLGEFTGEVEYSGFCEYPLYKFY